MSEADGRPSVWVVSQIVEERRPGPTVFSRDVIHVAEMVSYVHASEAGARKRVDELSHILPGRGYRIDGPMVVQP